jgi:hypothetical protein
MDGFDLTCFESHAAPETNPPFPQTLACGDTASRNGPYVRITPTQIVVTATNQRILFTVKRDR